MKIWLRQLRLMTGKELRQLWRDRPLAGFIAFIFTLDIAIAAGAGSRDLRDIRVLVDDADHSQASRDLVALVRPPYFRMVGQAADRAEATRRLESGDVMIVLDIPKGFEEALRRGAEPARAQLLVDASRATRGYLAAAFVAGIGERLAADAAAVPAGAAASSTVTLEPRVWFNPDLNPAWFLTVSELLTMLTVACLVLPAAALVREKERGTIEQLLVSPIAPVQVMLAKVIAMIAVTLAGTAVALAGIMQPIFHVPIRGSLALFLALSGVYAFTNAGLGLAIATYARNMGQLGLIVLLVITPVIMLSGTWVTIESMPPALRVATMLSPLRHFIDIAYGILLRGSGLTVLWPAVLKMTAIGAALFGAGLWRFRRQTVRIG